MRHRPGVVAVAVLLSAVVAGGCRTPDAAPPVVARGAPPDEPTTPKAAAAALLKSKPAGDEPAWVSAKPLPGLTKALAVRPPVQIQEERTPEEPQPLPSRVIPVEPGTPPREIQPAPSILPAFPKAERTDAVMVGGVAVPVPPDAFKPSPPAPPAIPPARDDPVVKPAVAAASVAPVPKPLPTTPVVSPSGVTTAEPPIRLPDIPVAPGPPPAPPPVVLPPVPQDVPPAPLPAIPLAPPAALPIPVGPGPIEVGGVPIPFDSLTRMIDGGNHPGTGCRTCGGGGCSACSGRGGVDQCSPGGHRCEPFPATTVVGRFVGLVYQEVCCPDPCWQGRWEPLPSAAFFTDSARPVTQTRVRWDYGQNRTFPDRGEFFMARADGHGKGPKANAPALGIPYLDYHELYVDTEVATGAAGVTISVPYRSINPGPFANSAAGFSDMQITAKSLLWDSELFLFAFQMRTYVPSGNFGKGLGTGHVSLEPSLIAGLRLSCNTYLQAQVAEWIPIAGDPDYAGAALFYSFSLNHVLWRPVRDVQLVGTLEATGFGFQDGLYTDAVLGPQKLSGQAGLGVGPGLRLFYCDKLDVGAGWQFGVTGKYLVRDLMRFEVRYRY
jgi:hypothetical protein